MVGQDPPFPRARVPRALEKDGAPAAAFAFRRFAPRTKHICIPTVRSVA